jgi:tetrahydromethanopterin S-methyltransferase subunit E
VSGDGQRPPKVDRRAVAARALAAGVFLVLELPLLLPLIVGTGVMALVLQTRALARRLSRGAS